MKKKIIQKGLLGALTGVTICYLITICVSLSLGEGVFYAVTSEMVGAFGNELTAVIVQLFLSAAMGFVLGAASLIYDNDWGIVKQVAVHSLLLMAAILPTAYICHWMQHSIKGFLIYLGIFLAIYVVIGAVQLLVWKKRVKDINSRLGSKDNNIH